MIRMSRYFDVSQNAVLFFDMMLPMEAFMTTGDSAEMNLVTQIFEFVKSLAEVRLSETALALFSAYILLQEGNFWFFQLQLQKWILLQKFYVTWTVKNPD